MKRWCRVIAGVVAGIISLATSAAPVVPSASRLAIIIDDMGSREQESRRALRLPSGVTYAFIPFARHTATLAPLAQQHGREIMVHLPMESPDSPVSAPDTLYRSMPDAMLTRVLQANLSRLPYAAGVNNHMGSTLTADARAMDIVMQALGHTRLYFVDSRTTKDTLAAAFARHDGIDQISRDVFLDNVLSADAIDAAFTTLLDKARKRGFAVGIGHPHTSTLTVLERRLPEAITAGVQVVPISRLIAFTHGRSEAPTPAYAYTAVISRQRPPGAVQRMASVLDD